MDNLGDILKEVRQQQQLSQLETAEDICSQSTLSEIEHNKYIPSTQLLINICEKLSIVFDDLALAGNFNICKESYFNRKASEYYQAQEYLQLKNFLNRPTVLETVQTNKQTQAYYFYLALCALKLDHKYDNAKELLKLSLASAGRSRNQSTLTRLGNIALGYVYAQQGFKNSTIRQINLAFSNLSKKEYDENFNLIFYMAALSYFQLSKLDLAIETIEHGINYIIKNESHFMLINSLYLMANITEVIKQNNTQLAIKSYDIFNAFIHERSYETVN
ncbi:helix-turn-helix domain-containing protein [Companilactobacillus huachuanensis]|uniref:Helix-turn-helix domain-containing protein n=1 Tax=Companilactobacillus huachuanensis TaxID=2559914 RepID=A0ABW1RNE3_9LACO|nr:helix-turn-helix transcriptional regulator [Companilactobacillus huachuanensis]